MYRLIYFGSPQFSAQILASLLEMKQIKVVGVVTNPTATPVAQVASAHHLPLFQPTKLDSDNLAHLKLLKPDLFLVAAYGKIIPSDWLALPKIAPLNLHFSLLPKYRGALCISEALKNGQIETGVTLMEIDAQMDHGPVISQIKQTIDITDNVATLTTKLTQKAIALLASNLPRYLQGEIKPQPQDETQATYTPLFKTRTRESASIPWDQIEKALQGQNALSAHNLIRSLNPDPGAWTCLPTGTAKIKDQELKLLETRVTKDRLEIITIQLPGKKEITWRQFLAGRPLAEAGHFHSA